MLKEDVAVMGDQNHHLLQDLPAAFLWYCNNKIIFV